MQAGRKMSSRLLPLYQHPVRSNIANDVPFLCNAALPGRESVVLLSKVCNVIDIVSAVSIVLEYLASPSFGALRR